MKHLCVFVLLIAVSQQLSAQIKSSTHVHRKIHLKTFGVDRINLSLNGEYFLIEDSCAQIIRYGHINLKDRVFTGKFRDVSVADSSLVVAEGNYSANGLKDGEFTTHYLNGNLQASGSFKNNKYDGKWQVYYEDGKPELTFEAENNIIRIINAWDADGKQTVNNGNGKYQDNIDGYYWEGKLINGKPDGNWKFIKAYKGDYITVSSESFKNGQLYKGDSPTGSYTDSSRIVLVDPDLLPFTNAEKLQVSPLACDGSGYVRVISAYYSVGKEAYTDEIKRNVAIYLRKIRLNYNYLINPITINGEISVNGTLENLHADAFSDENVSRAIINGLRSLPSLQPATANGKPVKENFKIIYVFERGLYRFNYHFIPISN